MAVASVLACAALAPAADASLSVSDAGRGIAVYSLAGFTSAAGGADNGTAIGEQSSGFRHVTWIGIAADGSDPGSTVIARGHVAALSRGRLQPWGLELGSDVAVANDGFTSVNPSASGLSGTPISWAPFNANTVDLQVVAPTTQAGTPVAAQTRGLGVTFLNVNAASTTGIQYIADAVPVAGFILHLNHEYGALRVGFLQVSHDRREGLLVRFERGGGERRRRVYCLSVPIDRMEIAGRVQQHPFGHVVLAAVLPRGEPEQYQTNIVLASFGQQAVDRRKVELPGLLFDQIPVDRYFDRVGMQVFHGSP
ncbi:MAG: hypothetical protein ACLP0L_06580, partial [Solirubrobacteraceae bacterium]